MDSTTKQCLATDTGGSSIAARKPSTVTRRIAAVIWLVMAAVGALYWLRPDDSQQANARVESGTPAALDAADLRAMQELPLVAARLRERLAKSPDDGPGWALLARTHAQLGEYANAGAAFEKAVALRKNDAALLIDYADTLAFLNKRSFEGMPLEMIERALKIEPDNVGALMLAGLAAFDRQDYTQAVAYWEHVVVTTGAGSTAGRQAQQGIDEVRRRGVARS